MRRRLVRSGCALLALAVIAVWGAMMGSRAEVHWSRVSIALLAPPTPSETNPSESLPMVAALLVLRLNDGPKRPISASREATLYGEGERQGYQVLLRNTGSQWQPIFDEPIIDVEIVGPTEAWVVSEVERLYDQASVELEQLQNELGVDPQQRIRTALLPPGEPNVSLISSMRSRLFAATGLLYAIAVIVAIRYVLRDERRAESRLVAPRE